MEIKDLKYKHNIEIDGVLYSLEHLRPMNCTIHNRKVYIVFSPHVWTDGKTHNPNVFYKHEKRSFCYQRYKQSLDLPSMIKDLKPDDRLMQSERNWFFIRCDSYYVFMRIKPSKNKRFDYYIYVQSAYTRNDRLLGNIRAIKYIIK